MQLGSHQFFSPGHEGLVKYWCKCVLGHEGEDLLAKLKYCCISALDQEGEDLLAKLKQHDVHSFMDDARREGGVVLVHCYYGASRSATTVISYLMKDEGLSFEEALADLMSRRDCVAPNRGFCDQLKILQEQCGGKLEKYEPEMLTDEKEAMSFQQWLALLKRNTSCTCLLQRRLRRGSPSVMRALSLGCAGHVRLLQWDAGACLETRFQVGRKPDLGS